MTHVVCRADENLRARRTVKYLMGLVNVGGRGEEGGGQGEGAGCRTLWASWVEGGGCGEGVVR